MATRAKKTDPIYIASETFACELDGDQIIVNKGITRVRHGHPLLNAYPGAFESLEEGVDFEVEQATAAPGEKRGDKD